MVKFYSFRIKLFPTLAADTMVKKINIFKSLNIEANEVGSVLLLITQSIFIGIFYGTFDIGAHTLFLKTYPEDMIPKAYIISGIVGILLTSIFSKYQSKLKFSKLAIRTLLFISFITILMRVFFEYTHANWTVFLVFILLGPLNILAILAFWGTVGRIFNLRQGKRLYGIIDSGQVFGIIVSSFAIPLIITYLNGTKNLLVISAGSIIIAMVIEAIITRKYKIDIVEQNADEPLLVQDEEEQLKIKKFIKDPYILYMALFVVFSMFAAFFIQYSFLVVTNEQYPNEENLAKYLGFFTGSMMAFTLLIKTFVYSKLLKTYGLKVSLILSSLLLALFTGIAIVVGFVSGYDKAAPGFIYFFLFISMGKLFNKTLKDALEAPAFKLLYQSLKKSIRFDVQAKIDGTINEIAALVSGVLLSILGALVFIKLIHFSIFLFVLLVIWAFITIKLYKEYRNSLERALKEVIHDDFVEIENQVILQFKNLINDTTKFSVKLTHIKNYLPGQYIKTLLTLSEKYSPSELSFLSREHTIELLLLNAQKLLPIKWSEYLELTYKVTPLKNPTIKELGVFLNSENLTDVNNTIHYLISLPNKQHLTLLGGLLRIPNIEVQQTTIRISGTLSELELINTLVEFLDSQFLFSSTLTSLLQMGNNSVKHLIQMFYKTDISLVTQLALIEVIGKYKTHEPIQFLLDNISNHRKEIKEKSIACLRQLEYQPSDKELPKMFHPITDASQTLAWDISALASLDSSYDDHPLKKAIHFEFLHHQQQLIDLLAITYDSKSVQNVQDYLSSETAEGISYGLELFDLFLSEEIKPMILTVFEDLPLTEKTSLFENFFPVEVTTPQELLLNIINRDPNLICKETKRTALLTYTHLFKEITDDLIAQLFSPVPELQQTAAHTINQIQPTKIKQFKPRMSTMLNKNLTQIDHSQDYTASLFTIAELFYKQLTIDKQLLSGLAEYFDLKKIDDSYFFTNTDQLNNYFVFLTLRQSNLPDELYLKLFIENNFKKEEIDSINIKYIIGVNKSKMSLMILTHGKVIEDLINKNI